MNAQQDAQSAQNADVRESTRYNGWANYPTWCVNLWLSNDEGLWGEALDITRDAIVYAEERERQSWADIISEQEGQRVAVADRLRDWVRDDLAPDLGASFASDLLGYALDEVDWHEIADAWIESASEEDDAA